MEFAAFEKKQWEIRGQARVHHAPWAEVCQKRSVTSTDGLCTATETGSSSTSPVRNVSSGLVARTTHNKV